MGIAGPIYAARQQRRATDAQTRAAEDANAEQRRQFDLTREDTRPYREVGVGALSRLAGLYGVQMFDEAAYLRNNPDVAAAGVDPREHWEKYGQFEGRASPYTGGGMSGFTESPEYQFNLAEGQRAIDRSSAARGRSLSGAAVKEGVRYASGMASNEFGNFYNRLANLAGIGQSANAQAGAAGMNAANNISANTIGAGNARATGYQNVGQIFQNASANTANNVALMSQLWRGGGGGTYGGYGGTGSYNGGGIRVV